MSNPKVQLLCLSTESILYKYTQYQWKFRLLCPWDFLPRLAPSPKWNPRVSVKVQHTSAQDLDMVSELPRGVDHHQVHIHIIIIFWCLNVTKNGKSRKPQPIELSILEFLIRIFRWKVGSSLDDYYFPSKWKEIHDLGQIDWSIFVWKVQVRVYKWKNNCIREKIDLV